jgi:hypothetical protein
LVVLVAGLGGGAVAGARPIAPPPTADTVHRVGDPCEPGTAGGVGVDRDDLTLGVICSRLPGDDRDLWGPLDSSVNPYVGSIDRLYGAYFDRAPDPIGFAYWIKQYVQAHQPLTLGTISDLFADSSEFRSTVPVPELVRWVYRTVLGREPDAGGHAHWTALLSSRRITPAQLMVFFSESSEFKAKTQTV